MGTGLAGRRNPFTVPAALSAYDDAFEMFWRSSTTMYDVMNGGESNMAEIGLSLKASMLYGPPNICSAILGGAIGTSVCPYTSLAILLNMLSC